MKYAELVEKARETYESEDTPHVVKAWLLANIIYPADEESEDEKMRKNLYKCLRYYVPNDIAEEYIEWLEKQSDIDLEHYKDGENEKRKFVGYGFLKCKGDFLSFKEGETYWLEYVGKDNYNVRSDNLLGQTFHIKPVELYTVFRPTTWLEKQGEQKQTWKPTAAQLIVIKDLIEDKNTSKVNKVILRGMLGEFKQYFGL